MIMHCTKLITNRIKTPKQFSNKSFYPNIFYLSFFTNVKITSRLAISFEHH